MCVKILWGPCSLSKKHSKKIGIFFMKKSASPTVLGRKKYFVYSYRMCECVGLREITLPTAGEPYQTVPNHTKPVDLFGNVISFTTYTVQCTLYRHRGFSQNSHCLWVSPCSRIQEVSYIENSATVTVCMRGSWGQVS